MIMGVAAIFGMFAGTFYWFPKATGRMLNEFLGKLHFYLTFIGVYAIFTPDALPGSSGQSAPLFGFQQRRIPGRRDP